MATAITALAFLAGCQAASPAGPPEGRSPSNSVTTTSPTTSSPLTTSPTTSSTTSTTSTTTTSTNVTTSAAVAAVVREEFDAGVAVYRKQWTAFTAPGLFVLSTDSASGAVSPCGQLRPGDAFYCPTNNAVYLDLGWVEDFSYTARGRGGIAAIVAHELGHALQAQRHMVFTETGTVVDSELHADCLSGAVLAARGGSAVEIANAAADAYASGSDDWSNPQFHGTGRQRRDATLAGAERGFSACQGYVR